MPTSGISSFGISQGKIISVNWLLCYRFFVGLPTDLFAFEFGRSARFMDSTRWARSEAKVEAKLTTSNPR